MKTIGLLLCVLGISVLAARGEAVRNGNELALEYATADRAGRAALWKRAAGMFHTFRYLKVVKIEADQPKPGMFRLETMEPSSDAMVELRLSKKLSLELARMLRTNDCIAANGRIIEMKDAAPPRIVLDPAVLKARDREAPKPGLELMPELQDRR